MLGLFSLHVTVIRCKNEAFFTPIVIFETNGVKIGRYLHHFFVGRHRYTKSADNQIIDYQPILFGATQGVRTLDLRITNALLYQLS